MTNTTGSQSQGIDYHGRYKCLFNGEKAYVNASELNADTIENHFYCILNVFRDGIETNEIQRAMINVRFTNGMDVDLTIADYYHNLILWNAIVNVPARIMPMHLFFEKSYTKKIIKKWIDKFIIIPYRTRVDNVRLNNIINDALYHMTFIDEFAMYMANTINLEDTVKLMQENKEFYNCLHANLDGIPLEDAVKYAMDLTYKAVDIIKESGWHCMVDALITGEGINIKQLREFMISLVTKPDGTGSAFPMIINNSYINGGLDNIASLLIESSAGRVAQVLSKTNVGDSGYFARLLGLNNQDTKLHQDPNFVCSSMNFQEVFVKDENIFNKLNTGRYYRLDPKGIEFLLKSEDKDFLVGKTIYLRSPMTCASHAEGKGYCYRCIGELAYILKDINPGKYAAEKLSSELTQRLLSAKHLLESNIKRLLWTEHFNTYFELDANLIFMKDDVLIPGYTMVIDPLAIGLECDNDFDDLEYNQYVKEFEIVRQDGVREKIATADDDKIYFTRDFKAIINKRLSDGDEIIEIPLKELRNKNLFLINMINNELTKTLEKIDNLIDNVSTIKNMNRHEILQTLLQETIIGGLSITSVHLEILLSNQIRDLEEILEMPDWRISNMPTQQLSLTRALSNNPSISTSLSFEDIGRALYNPLTFRKTRPSYMDLFYMVKPQEFLARHESYVEHYIEEGTMREAMVELDGFYKENDDDDIED